MNPLSFFISKRALSSPKALENTYYLREPIQSHPIIPCMTFGLYFDCDYVLCLNEGPYSMIEISSTYIGNKKIWFTLESKINGEQVAGYNLRDKKEITELFSVLKIQSYENDITVAEDEKYYFINYSRIDKRPLSFQLKKAKSLKKSFFFNGNAMNHSQNLGIFSIFLESLNYTSIKKNLIPFKLQRTLGIPMTFQISQTVFGCSATSFKAVHQLDENNQVRIGDNLGSKFSFIKNGQYLELKSIQSFHKYKNNEKKTGELLFAAPLPDLRFLEIGKTFSQNASIIINNKVLSHLLFTISRTSESFEYCIEGLAPFWVKRKLIGTQENSIIHYKVENE